MYRVMRKYGRQVDYLSGWDDEFGTECIGDPNQAMLFGWLGHAESAAIRANRECRGANGSEKPVDMVFSVIYTRPWERLV